MKLNLFLLIVLTALVAANFGVSDNPTRRNFEAMPEMVRTIAYKSFAANPNFPDGKTLQLPPEGAIPRRSQREPARSGVFVYQTYCQPCHGPAGKGDGLVAQRGFPPPPSLLVDHALRLTDEQIYQIMSRGQKNMPSYAAQVPPLDRRAVIPYVRELQRGPKP
ncbi:MAG TPA: cytochrome c [Bryobacteraceae bacterium]|nr:cytochrome c [Bryobacteraceae bacterium]